MKINANILGGDVNVTNQADISALATGITFLDPLRNYFSIVTPSLLGTSTVSAKVLKSTITTGTGYSCGISSFTTAGRMLDVRKVIVRSDKKIRLTITRGMNAMNFPTGGEVHVVNPGIDLVVDINYLIRAGFGVAIFVTQWDDAILSDGTADAAQVALVNVSFQGTTKTDDVITNATFDTVYIGDSIESGTGYTYTSDMYCFKFRDYLRRNGVRTRNEIRSAPGSTTATHVLPAINNNYNLPKAKLYVVKLGTNNAAQGLTKAAYKSDMLQILDALLHGGNHDAQVLIWDAPPLNNNTYEASAVTFRTANQEIISSDTTGRLFRVDMTNSFDRTVTGNYNLSDGVHPIASAHTSMVDKAILYMQTGEGLRLLNTLQKF